MLNEQCRFVITSNIKNRQSWFPTRSLVCERFLQKCSYDVRAYKEVYFADQHKKVPSGRPTIKSRHVGCSKGCSHLRALYENYFFFNAVFFIWPLFMV